MTKRKPNPNGRRKPPKVTLAPDMPASPDFRAADGRFGVGDYIGVENTQRPPRGLATKREDDIGIPISDRRTG